MNLEKQRGALNTIKKIIANDKEIIGQTYILQCITEFYENLKNENKKLWQKLNVFKESQYSKTPRRKIKTF